MSRLSSVSVNKLEIQIMSLIVQADDSLLQVKKMTKFCKLDGLFALKGTSTKLSSLECRKEGRQQFCCYQNVSELLLGNKRVVRVVLIVTLLAAHQKGLAKLKSEGSHFAGLQEMGLELKGVWE